VNRTGLEEGARGLWWTWV